MIAGCAAGKYTCGLAPDGGDAGLRHLEHNGPAAERVALGHRSHSAAAARQVLPRQRRVQAKQAACKVTANVLSSKPFMLESPLVLCSWLLRCPAGALSPAYCTGRTGRSRGDSTVCGADLSQHNTLAPQRTTHALALFSLKAKLPQTECREVAN